MNHEEKLEKLYPYFKTKMEAIAKLSLKKKKNSHLSHLAKTYTEIYRKKETEFFQGQSTDFKKVRYKLCQQLLRETKNAPASLYRNHTRYLYLSYLHAIEHPEYLQTINLSLQSN